MEVRPIVSGGKPNRAAASFLTSVPSAVLLASCYAAAVHDEDHPMHIGLIGGIDPTAA